MGASEYAPLPPSVSPEAAAAVAAAAAGEGLGGAPVHVTGLSFDGGSSLTDYPVLAVATSDGRVSLLNLTVWRDDQVCAQGHGTKGR